MISRILLNIIANSNILHFLASKFILLIPNFLEHNLSKYKIIKNIFYTIKMDQVKGDYAEFGCFTGSSLKHAINCYNQYFEGNNKIFFYGFDSFEGFPEQVHSTFVNENFKSNYFKVKKIEKKIKNCKIIKGFFDKTLTEEFIKKKIKTIAFAFIDCDLAVSSRPVLKFIMPRLISGSFLMIDDFYNIDKNSNSILKEFKKYKKNFYFYKTFGLSGVVFRYIK